MIKPHKHIPPQQNKVVPGSKRLAIEAIKKKLVGKRLTYPEVFAIMDEIAHERLGSVLTTYFAAAGFSEGFDNSELSHLVRAMAATGEQLHFKGIVGDKHSTGGVAGTRTTMILVPIIAAAGIKIPKTSSRAITSPSGTADTMEVIAPVTFNPRQIERIVERVGGCIVWGGHLGLAPADDVIIQVEEPLAFESFDKIIVSIMAKKVASGATHVVFDIPVGANMKIQHLAQAEIIKRKFMQLSKQFNIKCDVDVNETHEPAGRGIGPVLEVRDVFAVLEQHKDRPLKLEQKALRLASRLLNLCFADMKPGRDEPAEEVAREILVSGKALTKMKEIIKAQGGDPDCSYTKLRLAPFAKELKSTKTGNISEVNNHDISVIARILGCPNDKKAGIYLNRRLEEQISKGELLCTLYSSDKWRLKEAVDTLEHLPIYRVQ